MKNNISSVTPKKLFPAVSQYEIWLADIPVMENSHIQNGRRPVVIVSNDLANTNSPVVTVVPLTARLRKLLLPTHVYLWGQGLDRASIALCEQVMALDKTHLLRRMGIVHKAYDRMALRHALAIQLGMEAQTEIVA